VPLAPEQTADAAATGRGDRNAAPVRRPSAPTPPARRTRRGAQRRTEHASHEVVAARRDDAVPPRAALSPEDVERVLALLDVTLAQLERTRATLAEVVRSMGVPVVPGVHIAQAHQPAAPSPVHDPPPALAGRRTAAGREPLRASVADDAPAPPTGMAALAPAALAEHVVDLRIAVPQGRLRARR
jgi:hypothetical protein